MSATAVVWEGQELAWDYGPRAARFLVRVTVEGEPVADRVRHARSILRLVRAHAAGLRADVTTDGLVVTIAVPHGYECVARGIAEHAGREVLR